MIEKVKFYLVPVLLLLVPDILNAQLTTARIFTDGMVLQRDTEIAVWGTAGAEDTIYVTLNSVTDTAYAATDGKWEVRLPAMSAGGPFVMTIANGVSAINRNSVYIGDVWLAAGQSNMAFKLSQSEGGAAEISSANYPTIRQFYVQTILGNEPAADVPSGSAWTPATSSYAGNFTAVGYYFARDLQQEINVPIGIINASVGGARIETYMSEEMLGYDEQDVILAKGENERQPTKAFNTMINPLTRVRLKGIIWYQAESNGDNMEDAISYGYLFKKLIISYRELWDMGDIPFIWVQLPNQGTAAIEDLPNAWDAWPRLRAAQSRALSLPNTGEATTIDVGDADIHPLKKEPVGHRLSLVARKVVYGEDIVYSGPRYKTHTLSEDGKVKFSFNHIGTGLSSNDSPGDSLHWFSMAGSNDTIYRAKAIIENDTVIVWSGQVPDPAVVRYAWEFNPTGINFYNNEDLPAVPFLVNVVNPPFGIANYSATDTIIERGKSTVLSWEVYGSSEITFNGETVDSTDGIKVWPQDTTMYIIKAVNTSDANNVEVDTIIINVIEPRPTISLKIEEGDLISPDTEINLVATAAAPGVYTVTNVKFYVNDTLLFIDEEAPYKTTYLPPSLGEFSIYAIVSNNNNDSVKSSEINLLVTDLQTIKYEAENATYTGSATKKNSTQASGGKYMDLTEGWTLTFNGVNVPETKDYQLSIRYLLNYESPKTQNLLVNNVAFTSIIFEAPNTSTWMTYRLNVPFVAGDNVITIQGSWNWMSFDYIAITGEGLISGTDNLYLKNKTVLQNYPNPFDRSTRIIYGTKGGSVKLEVLDITGRIILSLINEDKPGGLYSYEFNPGKLTDGIYFLRLTSNNEITVNQMVIKR